MRIELDLGVRHAVLERGSDPLNHAKILRTTGSPAGPTPGASIMKIGLDRARVTQRVTQHVSRRGRRRGDMDHTKATPFPPSTIAAATADKLEREARWAADPDRGWTFEPLPPPRASRRTWRTIEREQLVIVRASRYNETRLGSGRSVAAAIAQLRIELGLTPASTERATAGAR